MSFVEKDQDAILTDYNTQLVAEIPSANTSPAAYFTKLGKILAYLLATIYKVGSSILASHNVYEAVGEDLDNIAAEHGFVRKAAVVAVGEATFTGTNGTVIPVGTVIGTAYDSSGANTTFKTTEAGTVASGTATVDIEAVEAGAAGNVGAGTISVLDPAISGITAVTNAAPTTGGVDEEEDGDEDSEDTATFRGRLIEDIRNPKNGGTEADFERWAREVSGVTQAAALPQNRGAGTIDVVIAENNSVPSGSTVTAVQDYIDALRPVTADFEAVAAVAYPLNVTYTVTKETGYDNATVQANVVAAIEAYRKSLAIGGVIYGVDLDNAVHDAAGVLTFVRTAPASTITLTSTQIATQGTYSITVS